MAWSAEKSLSYRFKVLPVIHESLLQGNQKNQ